MRDFIDVIRLKSDMTPENPQDWIHFKGNIDDTMSKCISEKPTKTIAQLKEDYLNKGATPNFVRRKPTKTVDQIADEYAEKRKKLDDNELGI